MSKFRLAFPFSFLARPRASCCRPTFQPLQSVNPTLRAGFNSTARRRVPEANSQRYGTANEPPPQFSGGPSKAPPPKPAQGASAPPERQARIGPPKTQQAQDATNAEQKNKEAEQTSSEEVKDEQRDSETSGQQSTSSSGNVTSQQKNSSPPKSEEVPYSSSQGALNTIMNMEPPLSDQSSEEKPPHLEAPRYVHHFDTYTLVRDLQEGGFSEDEAVNIMKAVRAILADNMDLARDGILSKSDAEMQAYLFRAACSELRTEIRNNRSILTERMRTERTSLQHEVDILSQRVTADSASLKDELKGMFDDRKMASRMERREIENKVQEVNYAITARLNSEMRSEVEGLRWILVRRTAMALAAVAITALLTLRIAKAGEKRKDGAAEAAAAAALAASSATSARDAVKGVDGARSSEHTGSASENPDMVTLA